MGPQNAERGDATVVTEGDENRAVTCVETRQKSRAQERREACCRGQRGDCRRWTKATTKERTRKRAAPRHGQTRTKGDSSDCEGAASTHKYGGMGEQIALYHGWGATMKSKSLHHHKTERNEWPCRQWQIRTQQATVLFGGALSVDVEDAPHGLGDAHRVIAVLELAGAVVARKVRISKKVLATESW